MKRKIRRAIFQVLVLLLLVSAVFYFRQYPLAFDFSLFEPSSTEFSLQDLGGIEVHFCPQENCETILTSFLASASQSIHCALFEVELESVKQALLNKRRTLEVQVVTDDDYLKQFNYSFVRADRGGLMHNKFCVVDGKYVSTGSMNPTFNDAYKNNNNLILINSSLIAGNYEAEFQELWNGTFKKGSPVTNPSVSLGAVQLETYFCPDDACAEHVKRELEKAQESIYFMTFSFTHEGIGNMILLKNLENLTIRGVMEVRQIDEDSQYARLVQNNVSVRKDGNKNNLHHKVFIIDGKTVVTGSMNPTKGGDMRNDENLLIIRDAGIAGQFREEFEKVWGEGKES